MTSSLGQLRYLLLAGLMLAVLLLVIWDPGSSELASVTTEGGLQAHSGTNVKAARTSQSKDEIEESRSTGQEQKPSPNSARREARHTIPVFLQKPDGNQYVDAVGVELSYFCESFRDWNGGGLNDFDVYNPWRGEGTQRLPAVITNHKGEARIEVAREDVWIYARDGDAVMIYPIRADEDWERLCVEGVLRFLVPVEAIRVTMLHADGRPAPGVPLRLITSRFSNTRSPPGMTGQDGVAELFIAKKSIREGKQMFGEDGPKSIRLEAALYLLGRPTFTLEGFHQGVRVAEFRLPFCSRIVVTTNDVGYSGELVLHAKAGEYGSSALLSKVPSADGMRWEYDYLPLNIPVAVSLRTSSSIFAWNLPVPVLHGRSSGKPGGVKVLELNWKSVFLAAGRLIRDDSQRANKNVRLRVIPLSQRGIPCTEPLIIELSPNGDFEIALALADRGVHDIRHLWLQEVSDKRGIGEYSTAEYFVQNLEIIPGQQLQIGDLQQAPRNRLIEGTVRYADGVEFFGTGLGVSKILPAPTPGGDPIRLAVNMMNTGKDNSVGFDGKFMAEHAIVPFPCEYQIHAKIEGCAPYQSTFSPGIGNFDVILQPNCTVKITYRTALYDLAIIKLQLINEKGDVYSVVGANPMNRSREDSKPRVAILRRVPSGAYRFRVQTTTKQTLLEIPFVQIEGGDVEPPELQNLLIEQPGLVPLNLVTADGEPLVLGSKNSPGVNIFQHSADGYQERREFSTRQLQLMVHESLLAGDCVLSVVGYKPNELEGYRAGDEIIVQPIAPIRLRIQQPADLPNLFPFVLRISADSSTREANCIPVGSSNLKSENQWVYNFACPVKGNYQLHWLLLLQENGSPGQRNYLHSGPTMLFDPDDSGEEIVLTMPPEFLAEAKRRADRLRD